MRTRGLNSQRTEGKSTWPRDQNVQSHGIESGDKDAGQGAVRGQKWLLKAESSLGDAAWPTGGFKCFKSLVCCISWGCKESDTTERLNSNNNREGTRNQRWLLRSCSSTRGV